MPLYLRYESEKFYLADGKKRPFPSLRDPGDIDLSVIVPSYNEETRCELIIKTLKT